MFRDDSLHAYVFTRRQACSFTCLHACMRTCMLPPKKHLKSTQKPPKHFPKTSQNQAKRASKIILVGSLAAKRPQDASKTLQDIPKKAVWRRPGSLRGVLGRKSIQDGSKLAPQNGAKIRLEASWGRLGGVWGTSWERLGLSWGRLGTIFKACHLGSHVLIDF